jgi:hypothetical protein
MEEARVRLDCVLRDYPHLSESGWLVKADKDPASAAAHAAGREALRKHVDGFLACCRWLERAPRVRLGGWSSYAVKHLAEAALGRYVPNGMLIAAALALGLPCRFGESQNACVGLSASWLTRRAKIDGIAV